MKLIKIALLITLVASLKIPLANAQDDFNPPSDNPQINGLPGSSGQNPAPVLIDDSGDEDVD
jgi:hypothetical protein